MASVVNWSYLGGFLACNSFVTRKFCDLNVKMLSITTETSAGAVFVSWYTCLLKFWYKIKQDHENLSPDRWVYHHGGHFNQDLMDHVSEVQKFNLAALST